MKYKIGIQRLSQNQNDLAQQSKMQLAVPRKKQQTCSHQIDHNSKFLKPTILKFLQKVLDKIWSDFLI